MSILSNVTSAAVGGIWKVAAIALLAGMVTSSAYLGYQWHSAASERDTAFSERKRAEGARDVALTDNGELRGSIGRQNQSIIGLAQQSVDAQTKTATALLAYAPIKASLNVLAAKIAGMTPSSTCEDALARQRQAIDGLRAAK
jgi:hypothetical protein